MMNWLINILNKLGLLKEDLDYHLIRASMVIIFLFFGYQKWFDYEAQALIPYISHGGFPAMTERVAFLMKDLVLFAASFYLLKQDVVRLAHTAKRNDPVMEAQRGA